MVHLSLQTLNQVLSATSAMGGAETHHDRRCAPRLGVTWRSTAVLMGTQKGTPVEVQVRDISTGGAGLMYPGKIEAGQRLALRLPRTTQAALWVECVVRHCEPVTAEQSSVGVQFVRLMPLSAVPQSKTDPLFLAPHDLTAEEDDHVRQLQRRLQDELGG